jgi:hypothetical protein
MCPRRPSCARPTARRPMLPTPPPFHHRLGQGPCLAQFSLRATDSVTFAGGGKRRAFSQCREGADHG